MAPLVNVAHVPGPKNRTVGVPRFLIECKLFAPHIPKSHFKRVKKAARPHRVIAYLAEGGASPKPGFVVFGVAPDSSLARKIRKTASMCDPFYPCVFEPTHRFTLAEPSENVDIRGPQPSQEKAEEAFLESQRGAADVIKLRVKSFVGDAKLTTDVTFLPRPVEHQKAFYSGFEEYSSSLQQDATSQTAVEQVCIHAQHFTEVSKPLCILDRRPEASRVADRQLAQELPQLVVPDEITREYGTTTDVCTRLTNDIQRKQCAMFSKLALCFYHQCSTPAEPHVDGLCYTVSTIIMLGDRGLLLRIFIKDYTLSAPQVHFTNAKILGDWRVLQDGIELFTEREPVRVNLYNEDNFSPCHRSMRGPDGKFRFKAGQKPGTFLPPWELDAASDLDTASLKEDASNDAEKKSSTVWSRCKGLFR